MRRILGLVAVNVPPDPMHPKETTSPPLAVPAMAGPVMGAALPDAVPGVPKLPAALTETDPAQMIPPPLQLTETVLDPVGHVAPASP